MFSKYLIRATLPSAQQPGYRGDIDGLRAIAVLLILAYHLQVPGFSGGFLGVDVFFVISGFLMTSIVMGTLAQGRFHYGRFITARAFRLLPSLLVMLLLTLIGAAATLSIFDMKQFGESLLSSLLFVGNFYFEQHSGYFDSDSSTKPLLHLWSLGVEAQFYLLWPVLLLGAARVLPKQHLPILVAAVATLSLTSIFLLSPAHVNAVFYLLPSRLFEFMLGAAVVWLPRVKHDAQDGLVEDICMLAGLLLLGGALAFYSKESGFSVYPVVICFGAALLIYSAPSSTLRPALDNPVIRYVGSISYELYLFHWPLISLYLYTTGGALGLSEQAVLVLVTFALAAPVHHFIGQPLRHAYKAGAGAALWKKIIGFSLVIVLIGASASLLLSQGWVWRLPADNRLFIADPAQYHSLKFGGIGYHENQVLVLGDTNAKPSFIFIGDSHAGQYAAAFDELLKANGKSAYLYHVNGCLLIPGGSVHMQGSQTIECEGAHVALETLLSQHPSLPLIQAQSWESYQEGVYRTTPERIAYNNDASIDYYDRLIGTITQIKTYLGNRPYIVFGIAPGIENQQPIARCLSGPALFTQACQNTAAEPQETRLTGQAFNLKFAQYVARDPAIGFLNPRTALCHDGFCYALDSGRVLYSDRSHLTKDGAKKVLTHFQSIWLGL